MNNTSVYFWKKTKKNTHLFAVLLGLSIFLLLPQNVLSQHYYEVGALGGGMYYMGDVNPYMHLYKPQTAFGGVAKIVTNKHYSYRLSVMRGKVAGSDADFEDEYRKIRNHSFSVQLTELSLQTEFNFMPLLQKPHKDPWRNHATYVTSGVSFFIAPNPNGVSSRFAIPFGIGYKYVATKNINLAIEWLGHATFDDDLDQLQGTFGNEYAGKQRAFESSNDFFGTVAVALTYKLKTSNTQCPAYGTKKHKKK